MKRFLAYTTILTFCSISFWAGKLWGRRDIITYSVDEYRVAFDRSWPTYGLPLKDFETVLSSLRSGHMEAAMTKLEVFLDGVVYDARQRRSTLRGEDLVRFDRAVSAVAAYRKRYPRAVPRYSNTEESDPGHQLASRMLEIDRFLQKYQQ
jgi:hypothetical protein